MPKWLSDRSGAAMGASTRMRTGDEGRPYSPLSSASCHLDPVMNQVNRRVTLVARPDGYRTEATFKLVEDTVPSPGPGQVLVRALYLSLDPYMRGRMSAAKSYATPIPVSGVIEGGIVGPVVASENPRFKVGDYVEGRLGWQDYALSGGRNIRKIDPTIRKLSHKLGA